MNKELLDSAIKNLQIKIVYLSKSEISFHNNFDPLVANQELVGSFKIGMHSAEIKEIENSSGEKHKIIKYHIEVGMRYLKGPIPTKQELNDEDMLKILAAEIKAIFVAEYAMNDEVDELQNEAINEFGRINVPYHVWPYWREYCQSSCSRMSLPTTVIPMLTIK